MALTRGPQPPPPVGVALHIGVTGHRRLPDGAGDELRARVRDVLACWHAAGEALAAAGESEVGAPAFTVVSSLAEGADSLVASEGLKAGFALQCPLPFRRSEYATTMSSAAARDGYVALLDRAESVLELDGTLAAPEAYYLAAGRTMLSHVDALMAIWDGLEKGGVGGTAHVCEEALRAGLPVVWIHSQAPHAIQVLPGVPGADWRDRIRAHVATLRPDRTSDENRSQSSAGYLRYRSERAPRPGLTFLARSSVRLALLGSAVRTPSLVGSSPAAGRAGPDRAASSGSTLLGSHLGWAEALTEHYSNLCVASLLFQSVLAGCAVPVVLLVLYGSDSVRPSGVVLPPVLLGLLVLVTWAARRWRWQDRAADYRLLAELLHMAGYLRPLGLATPRPHRSAHGATWVDQHVRAVLRRTGIANGSVADQASAARRVLHDELDRLDDLYGARGVALEAVARRLYWGGVVLALLCGGVLLGSPARSVLQGLLAFGSWEATLVLPTLATVMLGFRAQSLLGRQAARARAMQAEVRRIRLALPPAESRARALVEFAETLALHVIDEVSDGRFPVGMRLSPF